MKNFFRKTKQDGAIFLNSDETLASEKAATADEQIKRRQTLQEGGVGDLEDIGEFGLGRALKDSKPVTKIELSKEKEAEIAAMEQYEEYEETQDDLILQQEEAAILAKMRKNKNKTSERRP